MWSRGKPEDALRELGRRTLPGSVVYFLVVVVVAVSTSFLNNHPWLAVTVGAFLLVLGAARGFVGWKLSREPDPERVNSLKWPLYLATIGGMTVWGLFCGAMAFLHLMEWQGMLVLLSGGALAAGTTASLAPDRNLAWTGLGTLVIPTVLASIARADAPGFGFGFLTAIYLAFLMVVAHQNWDSFRKASAVADSEKARMKAEGEASARSALLASVSHEIRTPLNGVVGLLELMAGSDLPPEQRERVSTAHASALQLVTLLDRILQYSKAEAGNIALELAPFDLRRMIAICLGPLEALAREKRLSFSCCIDDDVHPHYNGDSVRISQVLSNLVGNAIKFTSAGKVSIHVSSSELTAGRDLIQFAVVDTGIGLTPEARHRIFEPYAQADQHTSRRYGGTGLGLAISRQLVNHMYGEIVVDSEPGCGSTFSFSVPLERVVASEAAAARPHTGRVLLAEDNAINQIVTAQMLRGYGFEVDIVADGREAIAAAGRDAYDLILMDCYMPRMDGLEAARSIRQAEIGERRIPIIALTASALPEDRDCALAAGMDDFLSKPITSERLLAVIAPHLNRRPAARASHA